MKISLNHDHVFSCVFPSIFFLIASSDFPFLTVLLDGQTRILDSITRRAKFLPYIQVRLACQDDDDDDDSRQGNLNFDI
jgi:hypothetical protein